MERYCKACKATVPHHAGVALSNSLHASSDFPGDFSGPADDPRVKRGQTISRTGPARLIPVLKCSRCGRSVGL